MLRQRAKTAIAIEENSLYKDGVPIHDCVMARKLNSTVYVVLSSLVSSRDVGHARAFKRYGTIILRALFQGGMRVQAKSEKYNKLV